MAAETIRDVLIRIRIQQSNPTKLQAPDIGPAQQALDRAAKASTDAFTREERAAIQAYSRITAERQKAATAAEKLADRTAKYADRIDPTGGKVLSNEAAFNERQREQATQSEIRASNALAAASRSRIEALINIGEASFRTARGIAFLTAADEKDLQVALRRIAVYQGYYDVAAGGLSILKNLTMLTEAQVAAQLALNVAMSVTPAGWVAVGVAAAAAGTIYALTTDYTKQANEEMDRSSKKLNALATDWERLDEIAQRGSEALAAAGQDFNTAMEAMRIRGSAPNADMEQQIRDLEAEATIRKSLIDTERDRGNLGIGVIGSAQADAEKARIDMETMRETLRIRKEQTAELQKQRDIAADAINTAKQAAEVEKNRLTSQKERIGRLSAGDQLRLAGIGEKNARGEKINEADARFLEEKGFGQSLSSGFFRQRGEQAGADKILGDLGETQALEQMKKNIAANAATFVEFIRDADEQLREAQDRLKPDIEKFIQTVINSNALAQIVKQLEQRLGKVENDIVKRRVNGI